MLTSIVAVSYWLAALAFLFLSVLLMTSWRGRLHGIALSIACLATSAWAAAVGIIAVSGIAAIVLADALEICRNAAWLAFLALALVSTQTKGREQDWKGRALVAAILILHLLLLMVTVYIHARFGNVQSAANFYTNVVARLATAIFGMILVEQLYRNSASDARWAIKFACLGIGGLFAYDFYLYSDAMLFQKVNVEIWAARGLVDSLTVPFIAVSAARNPNWSTGIAVSRTMLLRSAALFGSALYLLAMAAAGYYIRLFGGAWGTVMQFAFLFGAAILLLTFLFSGSLRAWFKVFISKHFYSYSYDYRDEWMRFTHALSAEGSAPGERAVQAVARLMESPAGLLYVRRDEAECYELAVQWNMRPASRTEPFQGALCRFLEDTQWVVDVNEYRSTPEKYEQLLLPPWLLSTPKAWLVVPLLIGRRLFGFIVLAEARSRIKLNWEATDLLKVAGMQAASYLALQESANALMLARQFESYTRMSTFIMHDLKNLISQLTLLLSNAEKHRDNKAFQDDMLETIDYSVQKMKLLLQKISHGTARENRAQVWVAELLRQTIATKSHCEPRPVLSADDESLAVFADEERLERVLGHLIQNAIEATPKTGSVAVHVAREAENAVIEIIDTGHGMTEEFIRERLFKPFESTKSAGMGIGVFESQAYIRELGGRIDVVSRPSGGTTFRVVLPAYRQHSIEEKAA